MLGFISLSFLSIVVLVLRVCLFVFRRLWFKGWRTGIWQIRYVIFFILKGLACRTKLGNIILAANPFLIQVNVLLEHETGSNPSI